MTALNIIAKKRDGKELLENEIGFLISQYVQNKIPDYQMSAFLMAAYLKGLNEKETFALTTAFVHSGKTLDFSFLNRPVVDKHSTGGIGDKVTLVLAPMIAACGLPIAKMSGRCLGYTGGTIDKLESIPGLKTSLPAKKMVDQLENIDLVVTCASKEINPADKMIYALRDVTATVSSIPLIASSVMSKKIAGGAKIIVLDIKVGSGAFIKDIKEARKLAHLCIKIGKNAKLSVGALISNMDQPLGKTIGNSLELIEAIETLKGNGPDDLLELCLVLGSHILYKAGESDSLGVGRKRLLHSLKNNLALDKLRQMIKYQGGNEKIIDDFSLLAKAKIKTGVKPEKTGYIASFEGELIGKAACILGAGRLTKTDSIDHSVGIMFEKKVGDKITAADSFAIIHGNDKAKIKEAEDLLVKSIKISKNPPGSKPLIYDVIK